MDKGKTVNLYTKTTQTEKSGEKSEIEFFAEGSYIEKNGIIYITYKETELSGMEGTTTTLKIAEKSLSIMRFGTHNSKLEFRQGEQTLTNYHTPYGNIEIIIDTHLLDMNLQLEGKSTIYLKYSLQANAEEAIMNEVIITIER
jgi:uncharacterized beta-barrel protein YwiB (DUF1934 family)